MLRDFSSAAEPNYKSRRERARTQPALLSAARNDGVQAHARAAARVQSAHALWPVQLVPADTHQINAQHIHVYSDFADRLCSIRMEKDALMLLANVAYLLDLLNAPYLVIHIHQTNENRLWLYRRCNRLWIN
ncbi:hypothetical protein AYI69_g4516 [Smittium culicis]|uniref:Uncharacterized protein n=1 Tax=Smittium culicis TaxID=133412 RepID=A0A1R1YDC7_9FUNG|nr:hypothetical protein AYI69_g4516 [Smittium culicis]